MMLENENKPESKNTKSEIETRAFNEELKKMLMELVEKGEEIIHLLNPRDATQSQIEFKNSINKAKKMKF
jgi:hypothetical protein